MPIRYSQEFKDSVVRRVLANELTIAQAAVQYRISDCTLRAWRRAAMNGSSLVQSKDTAAKKKVTKTVATLQLPKGVTYLNAYRAVVMMEVMSEEDFGHFCRREGYFASAIKEWAKWFEAHPNAVDVALLEDAERKISEQKKTISEKNWEIKHKDKALANTATMLMISKKAEAIWGTREE